MEKELELAQEFLRDAKYLLDKGALRSASSRVYYSMFHAARAILESLGESPKTHKGTISLFGEKVIQTNLMDKVFGSYLTKGFRERQSADYDGMILPDSDEITKIIRNAEKFLNEVERIIKDKYFIIK